MFNDIIVAHYNPDGTIVQQISVPIIYGPREKYLARLERDPKLDQKTAIDLPMISFELMTLRYDGNRKLPTTGRVLSRSQANNNAYTGVYNPVPYNMEFEVNIYASSVEDGARILEQIIPFFTPSWNATLKMLDDMPDVSTDIVVNLDGIVQDDQWTGNFETRSAVMWRLNLTVQAYFYGPVSTAKVIKIANTNLYGDTAATSPSATITTTPGLTANGQPTNDPALTIPYLNISETDPYDYIITIVENT